MILNELSFELDSEGLLEELPKMTKQAIEDYLSAGKEFEEIGYLLIDLPSDGLLSTKGGKAFKHKLWESILIELTILFCTKDKKYKTLRDNIKKTTSQKTLLGLVSGVVGGAFGTVSGAITPFIILGLCIFTKASKEAICKLYLEKFNDKISA